MDVTQDIVAPRQVDVQGFNKAMAHQKQQARASWKGQADHNDFYTQLAQKYSNTTFVGYHKHCEQTQIQALWTQDEVFQKTVSAPCCFFLLVNSTPLYAQSGGQEADHGIFCTDTAQGVIDDVQKTPGGALVYHRGRLTTGVLTKGQHITLTLNAKRRWGLAIHHSATHLLHQALRHHLGLHVLQKGSLVAQERLRFDFSHTQPVALQQKQHIMAEINKKIQENLSVSTETLSLKQAQQKGALALFDQRYADTVRVVSMGDYSLELCGGTHVPSTGVIGAVYITNETSVATGIRRMEAVAGPGLLSRLMYAEESLHDTARILKVSVKNLTSAAKKLVSCNPPLHKTPSSVQQHPTTTTEIWGGMQMICHTMYEHPGKLRSLADQLRHQKTNTLVVVASSYEKKGAVVVALTEDLTKKYNAIELVKEGVCALGGRGGGGRVDMAQGGGPYGDNINQAISAMKKFLLSLSH